MVAVRVQHCDTQRCISLNAPTAERLVQLVHFSRHFGYGSLEDADGTIMADGELQEGAVYTWYPAPRSEVEASLLAALQGLRQRVADALRLMDVPDEHSGFNREDCTVNNTEGGKGAEDSFHGTGNSNGSKSDHSSADDSSQEGQADTSVQDTMLVGPLVKVLVKNALTGYSTPLCQSSAEQLIATTWASPSFGLGTLEDRQGEIVTDQYPLEEGASFIWYPAPLRGPGPLEDWAAYIARQLADLKDLMTKVEQLAAASKQADRKQEDDDDGRFLRVAKKARRDQA